MPACKRTYAGLHRGLPAHSPVCSSPCCLAWPVITVEAFLKVEADAPTPGRACPQATDW